MSASPSAAGSSYGEMQAAISHQAVGRLIRSPRTARSVMATGPASGSARTRPSGSPGLGMPGVCRPGSLPWRGRGTQRCRPNVRACLGMVFAVTLASPNDPPAWPRGAEEDEPRLRRTGPGIPKLGSSYYGTRLSLDLLQRAGRNTEAGTQLAANPQ